MTLVGPRVVTTDDNQRHYSVSRLQRPDSAGRSGDEPLVMNMDVTR